MVTIAPAPSGATSSPARSVSAPRTLAPLLAAPPDDDNFERGLGWLLDGFARELGS